MSAAQDLKRHKHHTAVSVQIIKTKKVRSVTFFHAGSPVLHFTGEFPELPLHVQEVIVAIDDCIQIEAEKLPPEESHGPKKKDTAQVSTARSPKTQKE